MDTAVFARYRAAVRDAYTGGIGCTTEAFATERVTIVDRPEPRRGRMRRCWQPSGPEPFSASPRAYDPLPKLTRGLAPVVVRAATAEIVRRGQVPFYACAATNIRSQRTALASGFLPVCSDAAIVRVPPRNPSPE